MSASIRVLSKLASNYAPSRPLGFEEVHLFVALQLMNAKGHTSRQTLCSALELGAGTVRTMVKHLKKEEIVSTSKTGTRLTRRGLDILFGLGSAIPKESALPRCSVALGKFNYCVRLRNMSHSVRTGIEQRDAAIHIGATGATTLIFQSGRLMMPNSEFDILSSEPTSGKMIIESLAPEDGDVIIIGSSDTKRKKAELAAKNAALVTLRS